MTSTKVEFSCSRIARIRSLADLGDLLFPGNRNHQYAFLVIWMSLKWAADGLVPDLSADARAQGVSRRTLERVRAKMRRMGLIDHISRFDRQYGNREGWILSTRIERSLERLTQRIAEARDVDRTSREQERRLLDVAWARRKVTDEADE